MSQPIYLVHILTANGWVPLAQSGKAPYVFDSARDAWRMADICYPDQCREMRLGGPEQVRVTALSPDRYTEMYIDPPTLEIPQLLEATA